MVIAFQFASHTEFVLLIYIDNFLFDSGLRYKRVFFNTKPGLKLGFRGYLSWCIDSLAFKRFILLLFFSIFEHF